MPELPEVETVVKYIKPKLIGKVVENIVSKNNYDRVFHDCSQSFINKKATRQKIFDVFRRGKYIVIDLKTGVLLIHLRMTGKLLFQLSDSDNPKHFTAAIYFTDGTVLYFKDYRKFGRIYYRNSLKELNDKLGFEPLSLDFKESDLVRELKGRKRQIKPFLLDQSIIAGLGNIYVDEALWMAKIHPAELSKNLTKQQVSDLYGSIRNVLKRAVQMKGTTIINFSFGDSEEGRFSAELKIYGKSDSPCNRCGEIILKTRIAQRGTYYCPACQKFT